MKSIFLTIDDPQVLGSIERNLHNKYTYLKAKVLSLKMVKIGNGVI
jgi:hypothetical protein